MVALTKLAHGGGEAAGRCGHRRGSRPHPTLVKRPAPSGPPGPEGLQKTKREGMKARSPISNIQGCSPGRSGRSWSLSNGWEPCPPGFVPPSMTPAVDLTVSPRGRQGTTPPISVPPTLTPGAPTSSQSPPHTHPREPPPSLRVPPTLSQGAPTSSQSPPHTHPREPPPPLRVPPHAHPRSPHLVPQCPPHTHPRTPRPGLSVTPLTLTGTPLSPGTRPQPLCSVRCITGAQRPLAVGGRVPTGE